jgi:hypothetical protein
MWEILHVKDKTCPWGSSLEMNIEVIVGSQDKGLILRRNYDFFSSEIYTDVDFAGMHGYEDPENPESIWRLTGCVITIVKCPVLWVSRTQKEMVLSRMMAEYIALSIRMRDLIVLKWLTEEVCSHMGLLDERLVTVLDGDNNGTLTLAKYTKTLVVCGTLSSVFNLPLLDSRAQISAENKVTLKRGIAFKRQQRRPMRTGRDKPLESFEKIHSPQRVSIVNPR